MKLYKINSPAPAHELFQTCQQIGITAITVPGEQAVIAFLSSREKAELEAAELVNFTIVNH